MMHFGRALGATLIAEGIETQAQRGALQTLGVTIGQGYLLGGPAPAASFAASPVSRAAE